MSVIEPAARNARSRVSAFEQIVERADRRHERGAVLLHQRHRPVAQQQRMFERIDPRFDRPIGIGAIAVDRDRHAKRMRFVDRSGELFLVRRGADLDPVGQAADLLAHRLAPFPRPVNAMRIAAEIGLLAAGCSRGDFVAMPARAGDQLAAPQHARAADHPAIDGFLDAQGDIVDRAHVARRGDARGDHLIGQDCPADRRRGRALRIAGHVGTALLGEVDVEVDQAGEDPQARGIDRARGLGGHRRSGRPDRDDPVALKHHDRIRDRRSASPVEQRAAGQHDDQVTAAVDRGDRHAADIVGRLRNGALGMDQMRGQCPQQERRAHRRGPQQPLAPNPVPCRSDHAAAPIIPNYI